MYGRHKKTRYEKHPSYGWISLAELRVLNGESPSERAKMLKHVKDNQSKRP